MDIAQSEQTQLKVILLTELHFYTELCSRSEVKVTQSCPALCDPMDYIVYGIL